MTDFKQSLTYVKNSVYNSVEYEGITRKYFPKWAGWKLIDEGCVDYNKLDKLVDDFYYNYFWVKLKLDDVQEQNIADLIMYFAVQNGKRKAVQKLQRSLAVDETGLMTERLASGNIGFLELYCEYIEFCISYNKKKELEVLLSIYSKYRY